MSISFHNISVNFNRLESSDFKKAAALIAAVGVVSGFASYLFTGISETNKANQKVRGLNAQTTKEHDTKIHNISLKAALKAAVITMLGVALLGLTILSVHIPIPLETFWNYHEAKEAYDQLIALNPPRELMSHAKHSLDYIETAYDHYRLQLIDVNAFIKVMTDCRDLLKELIKALQN